LAAFLVLAGFGVTRYSTDGDFSVWTVPARAQAEFDRVARAIKGGSASSATGAQRRRAAATRGTTEPLTPVEPKVIEIEYDAEGNAIRSDATSDDLDQGMSAEADLMEYDRFDNAAERRAAFRAAGTVAFQDTTHHYSIDLPLAWQEMSSGELRQINQGARMLGFGSKITYHAGFRRKNTKPGTCPYILVSAKPGRLSSYEEVERALDRDIPRAVKQAEGALRTLASNMSVNGAALDRSTNRIIFRSQLDVHGAGTMQSLSVGHLGSHGVVFVHCYAFDKELSAWLPTFERINDSFHYEEGFAFGGGTSLASNRNGSLESVLSSGWGLGALLGAAGGVLVALITMVCRKPRRASSRLTDLRGDAHNDHHSVTLLEQERLQADALELGGASSFDKLPAPSPVRSLTSISRALSIAIPIVVFGTGGWCFYNHGAEFKDSISEIKRAVVYWCIEKWTGQNPDQIYSDTVSQVRAVTEKTRRTRSNRYGPPSHTTDSPRSLLRVCSRCSEHILSRFPLAYEHMSVENARRAPLYRYKIFLLVMALWGHFHNRRVKAVRVWSLSENNRIPNDTG
jgi:hypothetical protein